MAYQAQGSGVQAAGVTPRFVALVIDHALVGIIAGALNHQINIALAVSSVVAILNFIVLEGTTGATLGKMILGLRVVKLDGSPIGLFEAIIRNILRVVDALPFAYILGVILASTSPLKQRLGDRVAQTVVVKRR